MTSPAFGKILRPRATIREHDVLKLSYTVNGRRHTRRITVAENVQWKRWLRRIKETP